MSSRCKGRKHFCKYFSLCRTEPGTRPFDEPKFIVFYSALLSIFTLFCFNCKQDKPTVEVLRNGSMATVVQTCKHCGSNRKFKWRSQPFVFGKISSRKPDDVLWNSYVWNQYQPNHSCLPSHGTLRHITPDIFCPSKEVSVPFIACTLGKIPECTV